MYSFEIVEKADVDAFANELGVKPCYAPVFDDGGETHECKSVMFEIRDAEDNIDFRQVIKDHILKEMADGFNIGYFYQIQMHTIDMNLKIGEDFVPIPVDENHVPDILYRVVLRFAQCS